MNMKPNTITLDAIMDLTAAEGLKQQLLEALSGESSLVIDVSGVDFIATPCVQLLLAAQMSAKKAGGFLKFTNMTPAFHSAVKDLGALALTEKEEE